MHPLHAIDAGLAENPPTAGDLIRAIPRDELTFRFHPGDAEAEQAVETARLGIALGLGTGAVPLKGEAPNAWSIFWYSGDLMLRGHLFGRRGKADPTSPLVLANRMTRATVYGPKVPTLAMSVLGNTLAYEALDE